MGELSPGVSGTSVTLNANHAGSSSPYQALALASVGLGFIALFSPGLAALWTRWGSDPEMSHGYLVPLVSGLLIYQRRNVPEPVTHPHREGATVVLLAALIFLLSGRITVTPFLEASAVLLGLLGTLWFLWGLGFLRKHAFALFFLLFAIPPPNPILDPLRLFLRRIATLAASGVLVKLGIPALPEGNTLSLGDGTLGVADACSGVRSLVAITAAAAFFAYLVRAGFWPATILVLTALPVTFAVNVLRIVVVAFALVSLRIDLTEGTPHEVLGIAVFALSLGLLLLNWQFLSWLLRLKAREEATP